MGKPDFWGSLFVIKRDGKKVNFKGEKIAVAIKKGFDSVENEAYSEEDTNKVYLKVLETIEKDFEGKKEIGIEDIQNSLKETYKLLIIMMFLFLFQSIEKDVGFLVKTLWLNNIN
jgi:transcriptional regulator NrdR family protein